MHPDHLDSGLSYLISVTQIVGHLHIIDEFSMKYTNHVPKQVFHYQAFLRPRCGLSFHQYPFAGKRRSVLTVILVIQSGAT